MGKLAVSLPTSVDFIVPYSPDGGLRDGNLAYLQGCWQEAYPWVNTYFGDCSGPVWNKAEAIHDAVVQGDGEVLVVTDADVWVHPAYVAEAVRRVHRSGRWVMPHQKVYRLDKASSAVWKPYEKTPMKCERLPYMGVPGGGMFIIRRSDYEFVPMDQRFVGHSGQDIAWAHAADTLIGAHTRLKGKMIHLHHEPQPTKGDVGFSTPNFQLMRKYGLARSSRKRMLQLVESGRIT